ncbi:MULTISPECIES: helix-turn-helix domain-containing protein [Streptomyces]|uniref:helix-turn-helix domain-containing protein n=1 Tax=Streptomyces TaxID=1883 RepID=UPI002FDBF375
MSSRRYVPSPGGPSRNPDGTRQSPSHTPTRSELQKPRGRARLTSTQASQLLGVKQSQICNTEAGRMGMSAERVRALA